ncbi:MAG TPA: hypothetical protein VID27_17170, partial [Blastocatellia bacterium]
LKDRVITDEETAFVERLMERTGATQKISMPGTATPPPLKERLAEYLRQMVAIWRVDFAEATRQAHKGREVWRWQSEDGRLQARAIIEENADLTILISSKDTSLEGVRLNFRLRELSREMIMRRVSDSEVEAKVSIPREHRRRPPTDISIEIV